MLGPAFPATPHKRRIAVLGAPSSIGIRPYDDGRERLLTRAPAVLRERGLIERLDAIDLGDVVPPPYRDFERPASRPRNEAETLRYTRALAERVAAAKSGRFCLVLGGDCSIVLGCLHGARRKAGDAVGLVYIDAHADFATVEESRTGSVASMGLALAIGRGSGPLTRVSTRGPLVDPRHVALLGRRDEQEMWYGTALINSAIVDLPDSVLRSRDAGWVAAAALAPVTARGVCGFWIQIDADVLNPVAMSAVDSPEPGGLMPEQLLEVLQPIVHHPRALGLSVTIYDPALDPDRSCARQLVRMLEALFAWPPSRWPSITPPRSLRPR